MEWADMVPSEIIQSIILKGEKMNHEQLVINNLGLEIANAQVTIADLKAQLELKNRELNQANLTIENLRKENDSLNNAYTKKDEEVIDNG
jgi:hypothetical protein